MNETLKEIEAECQKLMEQSPSAEVVTLANCIKGLAAAIQILEARTVHLDNDDSVWERD